MNAPEKVETSAIGAAIRRKEDMRFLTGAGQYTRITSYNVCYTKLLRTGLDPIIRNSILNLICHTFHQHGFTMVMISHDIPEIFLWSHYVVVLHDGKVVQSDRTEKVTRSANPFVQQLIRGDITGPVHLM